MLKVKAEDIETGKTRYVEGGIMFDNGRSFVPYRPKTLCSVCGDEIKDGYPMVHSASGAHRCIFCASELFGNDTPLRRLACRAYRYGREVKYFSSDTMQRIYEKISKWNSR